MVNINHKPICSGSNRITTLFNKWKNNPQSSFAKEISKTASNRKRGRGEKLLSRPTIVYRPESDAFKILLPKQILRGCTEEENPCWIICAGDKQIKALPELLRGKAFLFTAEDSIAIDKSLLFQEFEIKLSSERTRSIMFIIFGLFRLRIRVLWLMNWLNFQMEN